MLGCIYVLILADSAYLGGEDGAFNCRSAFPFWQHGAVAVI